MDGLQFAALYTLQHRLARHAEPFGGFPHWSITFWSLLDKECLQLLGDADAPGCTWRDLLTGDKAVVEPAVERRGRDIEDVAPPPGW